MKFRKKPVVVDAVKYDGTGISARECIDFIGANGNLDCEKIAIHTLEGIVTASPGDWIIRGVNGEYYPCKPDIFEKTYEKV